MQICKGEKIAWEIQLQICNSFSWITIFLENLQGKMRPLQMDLQEGKL